jgi:hypothetical protein
MDYLLRKLELAIYLTFSVTRYHLDRIASRLTDRNAAEDEIQLASRATHFIELFE